MPSQESPERHIAAKVLVEEHEDDVNHGACVWGRRCTSGFTTQLQWATQLSEWCQLQLFRS